MIRAPAFWASDAWPARLLAPFGAITAAATARRVGRGGWVAPVPVFCCGNATIGGAGKTTLALDLGARLAASGRAVHFLTRGYGGRVRGVLRVDPLRHDAGLVGDEALLLAGVAPSWVGGDRAAAARAAIAAGAEVLVMDDGLQNPALAARRNLLTIDGGFGFGNGRLFPAGPLREPPAAAAARCAAAVLIGPDVQGALAAVPGLPVLRARLASLPPALPGPFYAFAGIARPAKFFDGLAQAGVVLAGTQAFADHHRFTAGELARLRAAAAARGAMPITTAKDAVRLSPAERAGIAVAGARLIWEDEAALEQLLA